MNKIVLDIQQAKKYYSYSEFKEMVDRLFQQGLNTGPNQMEILLESTKMSIQRMKKWDKVFKTSEVLKSELKTVGGTWTWYVITEGWCGDASQIIPVLAKIANESQNIDLKILLRDENPDIMSNYLTNGGMAIPVMVAVNNETGESAPHFGPRPTAIQKRVEEYKEQNPVLDKYEFSKTLHLWYAKDKGESIQADVNELIKEYMQEEKEEMHKVG